jgi:hypothetical protein
MDVNVLVYAYKEDMDDHCKHQPKSAAIWVFVNAIYCTLTQRLLKSIFKLLKQKKEIWDECLAIENDSYKYR